MPKTESETGQNPGSLVLSELPGPNGRTRIAARGIAMPAVKCSVNGCTRKLQPILKVDPRDRDTWFYQECDVCFKPVCGKHSTEVEDRIICDRCRKAAETRESQVRLIDIGIRSQSIAE